MKVSRYFLDAIREHFVLWSTFSHNGKEAVIIREAMLAGRTLSVENSTPNSLRVSGMALICSKVRRLSPNKRTDIRLGVLLTPMNHVWVVCNSVAHEHMEIQWGEMYAGESFPETQATFRYYHGKRGKQIVCIDFRSQLLPFATEGTA